jgi:uncharacterized protein (DUF1800 family)
MELFSLGVGHYSERDIREAARAFTGWHTKGENFTFDPVLHDDGTKTVLGRTGRWNGDDVVRIVLEQPAAARYLVRKLYHYIVSESVEPPESFLEPLADAFRKSDYDIAALVQRLLSSRHFYSEHAFGQRIKNPVEYLLGAVQAVYRRYDEGEADYKPLPQQVLVPWLGEMGQPLFTPPNVKGWAGGRAWLNTATVLARANFATALALGTLWNESPPPAGRGAAVSELAGEKVPHSRALRSGVSDLAEEPAPPRALDGARILNEERVTRPADVVRALLDLYLPGGAGPKERAALTAFVAEGNPAEAALERRVREVVQAILTMPEYQLA